jgi:hypothetical protein
MMLLTS